MNKSHMIKMLVFAISVMMSFVMVSCDKENLDTPLASVSEKNGSELVTTQVSDDVVLNSLEVVKKKNTIRYLP